MNHKRSWTAHAAFLFALLGFCCSSSNRFRFSPPGYTQAAGGCTWMFREDPDDCNAYFQCIHGRSVLHRCPEGLSWNQKAQFCDWTYKTSCKVANLQENSVFGTIPADKDNEIADPKKKCSDYSMTPHPTDCSKFIQCDGFVQHIHSCTVGLYFDPILMVCNWEDNVECESSQPSPPVGPQVVVVTSAPTTTSTTTAATTTTMRPTTKPTTKPTSRPPTTTTLPTVASSVSTTTTTTKPTKPPGGGQTQYPILIPYGFDSDYKVVCYFTNWAAYRAGDGHFEPGHIDPSLCTHIIYGFGYMDPNTFELQMLDTWLDSPDGKNFYGQITAFAEMGIVPMLAIGGWNDSESPKWSLMLRDPQKMQNFIMSSCSFLKKYGFKGLDLDLEYPACPQTNCNKADEFQKSAFVILVKGLRAMCPGIVISAAVSCNENIIAQAYDVPSLSTSLDFINLMGYDIHGAWEDFTGINAPLFNMPGNDEYLSVVYGLNVYLGLGMAPEKIVLGIPMYGRSYSLKDENEHGLGAKATGPGNPGPILNQKGILSYTEICSMEWQESVHDSQGRIGPYKYNGTQWVSHDDTEIIRSKCQLIKKYGLGGGMIWSLDLDDFSNICGSGHYPLLRTINEELRGPNSGRVWRVTDSSLPANISSSGTRKNKNKKKSSGSNKKSRPSQKST